MKKLSLILSWTFGILGSLCAGGYMSYLLGINEIHIPIAVKESIEYERAIGEIRGEIFGPLILGFLFIVLCSYFGSLHHRLCKEKKNTLKKEDIKGPFVLYLRSFIDDQITKNNDAPINDNRSEEEVLVSILSDIAPVYAIGNPADKQAPIGASRIYVNNEHWKETVEWLAQRAVLLALRIGKTDSFWWEVEMALKTVPLHKIFFVVPYSNTFDRISILYKYLLDKGYDLSDLNISIEKKKRGSISSFIYFNDNGSIGTKNVNVPRLSKLVLSYEEILRKNLNDFLSLYGLGRKKFRSVHKGRIFLMIAFVWCLFTSFCLYYQTKVKMDNPLPEEFVEMCIEKPSFVSKYSNEIDYNNLINALMEANNGYYMLDEEDFVFLLQTEHDALVYMDELEYDQMIAQPQWQFLFIKKYCNDVYDQYIAIWAKAVYNSFNNPEKLEEIKKHYSSMTADNLPDWLFEGIDEDLTDQEFLITLSETILEHAKNENIAEILKIIKAKQFTE